MVKNIEKTSYVKRDPKAAVTQSPWANQLASTIITGNKIQSVSASGMDCIDHSTGEILNLQAVQATRKVVDKTEFVKMYSLGILSMFDLKRGAQTMFKVVMKMYLDQKYQPDTLFLNEDSLKDYGYTLSRVSRSNALNQLIEAGFIAPQANRPGFFFINPNMFYKGDRMTIIKEYAIRGTESGDKMQQGIDSANANANQGQLPL